MIGVMSTTSSSRRRTIIKQFALGCAASLSGGSPLLQTLLAAGTPVLSSGTLRLAVSDFPALADELGSVRLDVGLDKPIIINRSDGFHVPSAFCQHNGCTVQRFDPEIGVMRCPCHGSQYNIDGSLNQGPALRGLNRFDALFDGQDTLIITLPGVSHAAKSITVVSTVGSVGRIKLTFHARVFTSYQGLHQDTLSGAANVTPFSLATEGAATEMVYRNARFYPADPLPEVSLYVDTSGDRGFYSITLLPFEA